MNKLLLTLLASLCLSSISAQKVSTMQRVENLLKQMTLEEKIGQLNQYSGDHKQTGPNRVSANKIEEIENGRLGSMLNVHGVETTYKLQEHAMKSRLKIPLLFAQDVIHGYRITFPLPLAEAASWDLKAIEKSARIAGEETAAAGVHWTFAPMVDISRDPRWGRVMEGAGEDTYLGCLIAQARVRGFQGKGIGQTDAVVACAKHFAGYGAAQAGRDYHSTDMSDRTLWEVYLPPFKAAVDVGVGTFMNGFNDLNGIPATGNNYLMRDILKGKWNFNGVVVSDWGSIREMIPHGFCKDEVEATEKAIMAGCDIDMESAYYIHHLAKLVKNGIVPESVVDDAVRQVLTLKFKLGLFDDPFRFSNNKREKKVLSDPSHRTFAKEMAEKSIVLLKNENNLLPLTQENKNIALIGPLVKSNSDMKGFWAVQWDDSELVSFYEGMFARAPKETKLHYAKGCEITSADKSGFAEAISVAKNADVVIMAMGETWDMSGEAKSRTDIHLPGVQEELIKEIKALGKPVVVLLMSGRPMVFNWTAENVNSILYTWFLGSEAGNAIASVLYGDYNPAGKLPMTFPRSVGQIPIFYNMKNTGRPAPEQDKISYGSAYIDSPNAPQYAFGYGLSYTTFDYSDLKLSSKVIRPDEKLLVSFTLKNTGKYEGEEVAQLYLRDISASVTRPVKELKGFKKVSLKAGESTILEFEIDREAMSFYDQKMNWIVEPGLFNVMVGGSSDKITLEQQFEVTK